MNNINLIKKMIPYFVGALCISVSLLLAGCNGDYFNNNNDTYTEGEYFVNETAQNYSYSGSAPATCVI